jgi:hypothetical protein
LDARRDEVLSFRTAVLILLGTAVALFWPALGGARMLWGADIQTLELVFKTAAARAAARGEWPLWMPELLCGMPGIAASNLVFLHPLELALRLLGTPPWMGFGLESALEVALSGLGMCLLLRRFGLGVGSALLGALAFQLSGTQLSLLYAGHINNSKAIAAIPWVFWGVLKGWEERRRLGWGLAGAALAWQVLGLGLQIFAYTLIALLAFAAWLAWARPAEGELPRAAWSRAAWGILVCGVAAFCLAAPQLLPSLRYKPYSWREEFSYEQFISWSFHPKEALTWIVPGYFGWREPWYHGDWPFCLTTEYFGLLPWALAFAALAAAWRSESWRRRLRRPEAFFLLLAVFSFLAGIGRHFPLHHLFYHLPVYNGFRTWTRFLCLLTFSVAVLAGFGWEALGREDSTRARRGALVFGALALLVALGALGLAEASVAKASALLVQKLGAGGPREALSQAQASAWRAAVLALLLLAAFASWEALRRRVPPLLWLALLFHGADLSPVARRYLEFKSPEEVLTRPAWLAVLPDGQGPEPFRILDLPGLWPQNSGALYGYETIQGYHGVQMAAPQKLAQALARRQLDWISLMNGRYILSPQALGLPKDFPLLSQGPVWIYQNPYALNRAFLLGRAEVVGSDAEAFQRLADPSFDVRGAVTLDRSVELDPGPPQGDVRWIRPRGNHLILESRCDRRCLLVLSQTWYPAWEAWVDGVPTPVLKADGGALTALVLGPGRHRVELRYSPRLLQGAGLLAALGLAGLFWLWRRERKEGAFR